MQRAIAVVDAADAARQGGRAASFSIREPGSPEGHSPPCRRSTRGRLSPNETYALRTTPSRRKRAHREVESGAEPEPLLHPARRLIPVPITSSANWVKKRRFMSLEEWFVEPRDDDASADFYTLL